MEVRLKNVFDGHPVPFCPIHVRRYFTQRIDDRRFSLALNKISTLGKASRVNLFNFHGYE
jgi:hypothetical protein